MSKVVWHVGAWSNNYGDRILQVGNTHILKEHMSEPVEFVYIDTQKTYFSEPLIEKMNAEADMLLIGGGGLLFHRPMDHSHSGWQFNIDTKNIDKIKIPIVVYGIGYNKFPYDEHVFPESMWDNVGKMIAKADLFSVRNEGTYCTLMNHVDDTSKVSIVPDAGMFVRATPFKHQALEGDHIKIGLNWATDRPGQRFGDNEAAEVAMRKTLETCKEIAEKHDAKIYVIEHLMPNELCDMTKMKLRVVAKSILGDRVVFTYESMFEELYPPFDYTAGFFADIYKQMDLVFGMRGHANIIPFGQYTPFVGIGTHNKVKWFLEEVGMPECFISLDDDNDFDWAIKLADQIINEPDRYKNQMIAVHSAMAKTKDVFMKQVVERLMR